MSCHRVLRTSPTEVAGTSEAFENIQEAEDWISSEWRRLLEEGVLAVSLVEDERELYTMKLTED